MRWRAPILVGISFVGLAAVAAYAAWAIRAGSRIGSGWAGLSSAWPYLLAGVLTVGCVIGGFVWLASFSERRGYDDRADMNKN
jgi:hypothetical protein